MLTFQVSSCLLTHEFIGSANLYKKCGGAYTLSSTRDFRAICNASIEGLQKTKLSPSVESDPLSTKKAFSLEEWKTIPDIWRTSAEKFGERIALVDPYHNPPTRISYKQLEQEILNFCEGLRVVGLKSSEKIALFADNSCRWLISDQAIMASGAINVVRGTRSSSQELLQIYNHSESVAMVLDTYEFYHQISQTFLAEASVRFIIFLWGKIPSAVSGTTNIPVYSYDDIIDLGLRSRTALGDFEVSREDQNHKPLQPDDVCTLVYTSGTTGNPKGVMLTHKNLLHQVMNLGDVLPVVPGDRFLSMLPPWHAYERAAEYFTFTCGIEHAYSSVKKLKEDLHSYQPHYMVSVPLVYETLYRRVMKQIFTSSAIRRNVAQLCLKISYAYMDAKRTYEGKCLTRDLEEPSLLSAAFEWLWSKIAAVILWPCHMLAKKIVYSKIHSSIGISKSGISGGGSLPSHVDRFFEAIEVNLQNGYGLTESSPVIAARRPDCNVLGSIGHPIRHTEVKVVDAETGAILPNGSSGIIKVRGPQVMKGYYKNPLATTQAVDDDGWLNTGDVGWVCPYHSVGRSRQAGGVIVLEGRAKDTIVLSTGENVEPSNIEEAAMRSSLIQQIMVVGQDQRRLGAVIVPNKEEILSEAKRLSILEHDSSELSKQKQVYLLREELKKWTSDCSFQVGPILVVDEPFTIENGLMTPTMKIKREKVMSLYRNQIQDLYK